MRLTRVWTLVAVSALAWSGQAQAQTADEVVEKHLAAMGGRASLAKLKTEVATGTITVSVQGADLSGPIEAYSKAPNKSRSYIRLDLSQFGQPDVVVDQRCDGNTAYASNSMQGDREITGRQLQAMLNERFPSALLTYKEDGAKVELAGREKVGTRDAYVLQYTPKAGPASRQYFDAETYLPLKVVMRIDAPEAGGEIEQTTATSDFREVGGIKVPFSIAINSAVQSVAITLTKVEHNVPIDDTMFARPAVK